MIENSIEYPVSDKIQKYIKDKASSISTYIDSQIKQQVGFLDTQLQDIVQIKRKIQNIDNKPLNFSHLNSNDIQLFNMYMDKNQQKQEQISTIFFDTFEITSSYIILWDSIQFTIHYILFCSLCLSFSFSMKLNEILAHKIIIGIFIIILSLDILMKFNRSFFEQGVLIKDHTKIAKQYVMKFQFLIDFIGVLSLTTSLQENTYLQHLFFLKVFYFISLTNCLEGRINLIVKYSRSIIVKVIKMAILFVGVLHIFTCIVLITEKYDENNNIFSKFQKLHGGMENQFKQVFNDSKEKYIHSLFFVITTIVPLGYGEVGPQNRIEKILTIIILFFGLGLFIYFTNIINSQSHQLLQQRMPQIQNLQAINNYMELKKINLKTKLAIQSYLKYRWTKFVPRNKLQEQSVLNILSPSLRQQILFESYYEFIKNCQFLSNMFSPLFLYKLASIIQELRVEPEETIYKDNLINQNDNNLFIIQQGEIDVYYQCDCQVHFYESKNCNYQKMENQQVDNMFITKKLKKNDIMGFTLFFFPNSGRVMRAKASTYTELLYINYNQFISLLQLFPSDYERYCYVKDEVTLYQNYGIIGQSCYFCGDKNHLVKNCNQIHHQINLKEKLSLYYKRNVQQHRMKIIRRQSKKSKTLLQNEEIIINFQKFMMINQRMINQYKSYFNINSQSSMSDLDDQYSIKDQKQNKNKKQDVLNQTGDFSKKILQKALTAKTTEHSPSNKTTNQQVNLSTQKAQSMTYAQSKQDILNKQFQHFQSNGQSSTVKSIMNNMNNNLTANNILQGSNQQIQQQQYSQMISLDMEQQYYNMNDAAEAHLFYQQNKSHQENSKREIPQPSIMADSMIMELKPSSYINLFERGKMDLEQIQTVPKKIQKQNLKKNFKQRSSLQVQMQQQSSPQSSSHLLPVNLNQTQNYEKRANSHNQDSRISLDSNIMKFLCPTNKYNENETQIYDHIYQEALKLNSSRYLQSPLQNFSNGLIPYQNINSPQQFLPYNQNHLFQKACKKQHQRISNQIHDENFTERKGSPLSQRNIREKLQSTQYDNYLINDSSQAEFQYYYPQWNFNYIISILCCKDLLVEENIERPLSFMKRLHNSKKQSIMINSFMQNPIKKSKQNKSKMNKIITKSDQKQNSKQQINQNDLSHMPLKQQHGNLSFSIDTNNNKIQNINLNQIYQVEEIQNSQNQSPLNCDFIKSITSQSPQKHKIVQNNLNIQQFQKEQKKIDKNEKGVIRKPSNSLNNVQYSQNIIGFNSNSKLPQSNNDQGVNLIRQNSSESYSNPTNSQNAFQKGKEQMRFVESQYSLNKGFTILGTLKRNSQVTNVFSNGIKNKTTEFYDEENSNINENDLTDDNHKTNADCNSSKDQYNLVYSHYNSTKNENINEPDDTNRPDMPVNNFNFYNKPIFQLQK